MTLDHKFGPDCDQSSPRLCWRAGGLMAPAFVLVGLVIMGATAIAARAAIVSIAPTTAALYAGVGLPVNLSGLSIAKVRVTVAQQTEGPGELLITGEIENLRHAKTSVPDLRLALRGEDGREIYVWTYMDPARLQRVWQRLVPRSQLLTYIRLPDAA